MTRPPLPDVSDIETMRMEAEARLGVPALEAEARRLREIIEGRSVPPTDAQIMAHAAAGGGWLLRDASDHSNPRVLLALDAHRGAALSEARAGAREGVRWWPLDVDGRPCAWPTVPA